MKPVNPQNRSWSEVSAYSVWTTLFLLVGIGAGGNWSAGNVLLAMLGWAGVIFTSMMYLYAPPWAQRP